MKKVFMLTQIAFIWSKIEVKTVIFWNIIKIKLQAEIKGPSTTEAMRS